MRIPRLKKQNILNIQRKKEKKNVPVRSTFHNEILMSAQRKEINLSDAN